MSNQNLYLGSVSLIGAIGPTGPQGPEGPQGPQGEPGNNYIIGTGLNVTDNTLTTVGNPNIQLVANSLFSNENIVTIQSQINSASQADVIYISAGSYSENIIINNKYNIALQSPFVGNTICQVTGLTVSGTSELIRIANLQIFGSESNLQGVGRNYFSRCTWQGSAGTPHTINIGAGVSKYLTFENCEFDQYCTINVSAFFGNVLYLINCNFGGAVLNLNQTSATQVIINNCAGHISFPVNATLIGMNVLAVTGESRNTATTTDSTTVKLKFLDISTGNTSASVNQMLVTDGEDGLKVAPSGGYNSFWNVFYETQQYTVETADSGTSIILYQKIDQANLLLNKRIVINFVANFAISVAGTAIFKLQKVINPTTFEDIQTITQRLTGTTHWHIPLQFNTVTDDFLLSVLPQLSVPVTCKNNSLKTKSLHI